MTALSAYGILWLWGNRAPLENDMNTLTSLGSPTHEARALLRDLSRKEALNWAHNSACHYFELAPTPWVIRLHAFWCEVAKAIRTA